MKKLKAGIDFSAGDAWQAYDTYCSIREMGSQKEADRRLNDERISQLIQWAMQNPRPSPLR